MASLARFSLRLAWAIHVFLLPRSILFPIVDVFPLKRNEKVLILLIFCLSNRNGPIEFSYVAQGRWEMPCVRRDCVKKVRWGV